MVTQLDIAQGAGVDVSTVNKILHRKAGPKFRKETISKVFQTARRLGYPVDSLKHPHCRIDGRQALNHPCELTVYGDAGDVFDKGTAVVSELSPSGARIENLKMPLSALPLKPFLIGIRLVGFDFEVQGKLVRFHPGNEISLGLALFPLEKGVEALLLKFIEGKV